MIFAVVFAINVAAILAWIGAHQALLLLAWPTLTAVASLVYTQLDKDTRIHAALSFLASIGVDLPKLWDALGRLLTGGGSTPSGGAKTTDVVSSSEQKKPTATLRCRFAYDFAAFVSCCGCILLLAACLSKPIAVTPSTPGDVAGAIACVTEDVIVGKNVDNCIAQYGEALIADALQMLMHSKRFADEHPEATAYTRMQLKTVLKAQEAEKW